MMSRRRVATFGAGRRALRVPLAGAVLTSATASTSTSKSGRTSSFTTTSALAGGSFLKYCARISFSAWYPDHRRRQSWPMSAASAQFGFGRERPSTVARTLWRRRATRVFSEMKAVFSSSISIRKCDELLCDERVLWTKAHFGVFDYDAGLHLRVKNLLAYTRRNRNVRRA